MPSALLGTIYNLFTPHGSFITFLFNTWGIWNSKKLGNRQCLAKTWTWVFLSPKSCLWNFASCSLLKQTYRYPKNSKSSFGVYKVLKHFHRKNLLFLGFGSSRQSIFVFADIQSAFLGIIWKAIRIFFFRKPGFTSLASLSPFFTLRNLNTYQTLVMGMITSLQRIFF